MKQNENKNHTWNRIKGFRLFFSIYSPDKDDQQLIIRGGAYYYHKVKYKILWNLQVGIMGYLLPFCEHACYNDKLQVTCFISKTQVGKCIPLFLFALRYQDPIF